MKAGGEFMDPIPVTNNGKGNFLMIKQLVSHFIGIFVFIKVARVKK